MSKPKSYFSEFVRKAWPHVWTGVIEVGTIAGGTPNNKNVVEGWIRSKFADNDTVIRDLVARTLIERGVTDQDMDSGAVIKDVAENLNVNGFLRDENGLYIPGGHLKSALREAISVAVASGNLPKMGWGRTNKGCVNFVNEHIQVPEKKLYLGVSEPSRRIQKFIHSRFGSSIAYEDCVDNAQISFTIESDWDFTDKDFWGYVWTTAERLGIGASRSQGYGKFTLIKWEKLPVKQLMSS